MSLFGKMLILLRYRDGYFVLFVIIVDNTINIKQNNLVHKLDCKHWNKCCVDQTKQ